jgi:hypothetical protein
VLCWLEGGEGSVCISVSQVSAHGDAPEVTPVPTSAE